MQIRFKKLKPQAKAPMRGSAKAAGWDVYACGGGRYDAEHGVTEYGTGLALEIPDGFVGLLICRSSRYRTKTQLPVGVIDSDYRGEVMAKFKGRRFPYADGERIAQLVVVPVPEVEYVETDALTETQRGANGYGSTGK